MPDKKEEKISGDAASALGLETASGADADALGLNDGPSINAPKGPGWEVPDPAETFVRGLSPIGGIPQAEGFLKAIKAKFGDTVPGPEVDPALPPGQVPPEAPNAGFMDLYRQFRDIASQRADQGREENPIAGLAGEATAGMVPGALIGKFAPAAKLGSSALTKLKAALPAAEISGLFGAVKGALDSPGDLTKGQTEEVGLDALKGGVAGAVTGGVAHAAPALAADTGVADRTMIRALGPNATKASEVVNRGDANEFANWLYESGGVRPMARPEGTLSTLQDINATAGKKMSSSLAALEPATPQADPVDVFKALRDRSQQTFSQGGPPGLKDRRQFDKSADAVRQWSLEEWRRQQAANAAGNAGSGVTAAAQAAAGAPSAGQAAAAQAPVPLGRINLTRAPAAGALPAPATPLPSGAPPGSRWAFRDPETGMVRAVEETAGGATKPPGPGGLTHVPDPTHPLRFDYSVPRIEQTELPPGSPPVVRGDNFTIRPPAPLAKATNVNPAQPFQPLPQPPPPGPQPQVIPPLPKATLEQTQRWTSRAQNEVPYGKTPSELTPEDRVSKQIAGIYKDWRDKNVAQEAARTGDTASFDMWRKALADSGMSKQAIGIARRPVAADLVTPLMGHALPGAAAAAMQAWTHDPLKAAAVLGAGELIMPRLPSTLGWLGKALGANANVTGAAGADAGQIAIAEWLRSKREEQRKGAQP